MLKVCLFPRGPSISWDLPTVISCETVLDSLKKLRIYFSFRKYKKINLRSEGVDAGDFDVVAVFLNSGGEVSRSSPFQFVLRGIESLKIVYK